MNPYLNNYIQTLHLNEVKQVHSILEKARVTPDQYDDIVNQLQSLNIFNTSFHIEGIRPFSKAVAAHITSPYEIYDGRMEDLFRASNLVALLIDSYSKSLISDVMAVESELIALEKAIGNYAFLLSDARSHDYAYLEPFSDNLNQDLSETYISDRDGKRFTPEQGVAQDTQEGALSISNTLRATHSLVANLVTTNYEPYKRSDTGIDKAAKVGSETGWRVSIASPAPIRSVLVEFEDLYGTPPSQYVGPLAVVDFTLETPATCDTIKLVPFSEFDLEITQVVLYHGDEGQERRPMLDGPIMVDSPVNLFFPMTSVSKFRVFLRQPTYTRLLPNANRKAEDLHRDSLSLMVRENQDRMKMLELMLSDMMQKIRLANQTSPDYDKYVVSDIPLSTIKLTDIVSFEQFIHDVGFQEPYTRIEEGTPVVGIGNRSQPVAFRADPETSKLIAKLREQLLMMGYYNMGGQASATEKSTDPVQAALPDPAGNGAATEAVSEPLLYSYHLGLKNALIGSGSEGFKAVYVSKILDAPSDLTDVKIKVSDFNYKQLNNYQELQPITSVEYSVTNDSNPTSEDAWHPILPATETQVFGERLQLDSLGKAYLRFRASTSAPISILKNNHPFNLNPATDYIADGEQYIIGVKIPSLNRSGTDVFTVSYTPAGDYTVVNFEDRGGVPLSLVAATSEDGVGESVINAFGQLSINLLHTPAIEKKISDTTLDPVLGVVGYQPIAVRLADGSLALNFTNYTPGGAPLPLDADAEEYQFIQNGNNLVFNKPLASNVRVYYKYIPCNVRFRVILRCNHNTFVSPKVDFLHLKAKTRKLL